MEQIVTDQKSNRGTYIAVLIIIWIVYAVLTILTPTAAQTTSRYGITPNEILLIRITFLVPYFLIWAAALFAIVNFKHYTSFLVNSTESSGFKKITTGLWFLLLTLIIPQFISVIAGYYSSSMHLQRLTVIISNYVSIILYFCAFWQLFAASKDLNKAIEKPNDKYITVVRPLLYCIIALLSLGYCWAIFHNPNRTISHDALVRPTYFLNDLMIVLTIIIPYVVIWLLGTLAFTNIMAFTKNVHGIIYKKAFENVASGLLSIIILSIGLQFLSQLGAFFGHASVQVILLIIYLILIGLGCAYLFIANGARKLAAIEKV